MKPPIAFAPLARRGRYVFPSLLTRDRPMSNNTINTALRRLGYASNEQTGHGFRSMASTLLNEQGFSPDVIELQLAHSQRNKVRAAYNKAQRLPERRKMMQAWADYLDALRERARVASDLRPYSTNVTRAPRPPAQGTPIVPPSLQPLSSLRAPLGCAVSRANLVSLGVRQLQFDDIRRESLLVEKGARHAAKSVTRLLVARVTEPPQRRIDGVIRHRAIASQK